MSNRTPKNPFRETIALPRAVASVLFAALILLGGCESCNRPPDVRSALLDSARKNEPDFPDGKNLMLTHFAYVGRLITKRGKVIYVVDQHSITAGALSPHGQHYIVFFDNRCRYLGHIGYDLSSPLWCDGSKLYLFGDLQSSWGNDLPRRFPNGVPAGNVIDVADGFDKLRIYHAKVYGSSGGLEDN